MHRPSATLSRPSVNRRLALTALGLGVLVAGPAIAVEAKAADGRDSAPAVQAAGAWSPAPTTLSAAGAPVPSATNAFIVITQATEAREQAARQRALNADRAARVKQRNARAVAEKRERAARIKARKAQARKWATPTVSGRVTGAFGAGGGQWSSGRHTGCDFDGNTGDAVRAVHTGVVLFAGNDGRYGKHVKIRHSNGDETWYAHLSSISVERGERVVTRDRIGSVGQTGNAFGSHLHFEVHLDGAKQATDPVRYLRKQGLNL